MKKLLHITEAIKIAEKAGWIKSFNTFIDEKGFYSLFDPGCIKYKVIGPNGGKIKLLFISRKKLKRRVLGKSGFCYMSRKRHFKECKLQDEMFNLRIDDDWGNDEKY